LPAAGRPAHPAPAPGPPSPAPSQPASPAARCPTSPGDPGGRETVMACLIASPRCARQGPRAGRRRQVASGLHRGAMPIYPGTRREGRGFCWSASFPPAPKTPPKAAARRGAVRNYDELPRTVRRCALCSGEGGRGTGGPSTSLGRCGRPAADPEAPFRPGAPGSTRAIAQGTRGARRRRRRWLCRRQAAGGAAAGASRCPWPRGQPQGRALPGFWPLHSRRSAPGALDSSDSPLCLAAPGNKAADVHT
jgi:hypothetical protein